MRQRPSSRQSMSGAPMGMLVMVQILRGWRATLLLVALVVVSDSAQYYSGRMLGRHAARAVHQPEEDRGGRGRRPDLRHRSSW